jgi:hypothetical protein
VPTLYAVGELPEAQAEPARQGIQHADGGLLAAHLDERDEGSVKFAASREVFLRVAQLGTPRLDFNGQSVNEWLVPAGPHGATVLSTCTLKTRVYRQLIAGIAIRTGEGSTSMNCTKPQHMSDWSERPLCRRYAAVVLDQVQVGPIAGCNERRMAFGWALGALSDGQAEVLGWWKPAESASLEWPQVGAKLAARGVERIGVIVDDSGVVSGLDAFGVPKVLAQSGPADAGNPASALPPHVQCQVARARVAAKRVQTALSRAVQRRWDGEGAIAAAAFLDDALQRIDRKLATEMPVPTARPPARHVGVVLPRPA